jgi:DNA-binding MarR family transcriptional regulator
MSISRLTLAVFRAQRALLADGDRIASAHGLTSARWKVLGMLAGPRTAADVGRAMGVSRQGAQKQLDALADARLVSRQDNPSDARAPRYAVTAKGARAYAALSEAWSIRSAELSGRLEGAATDAAADALHRLVKALEVPPSE